MAGEIQNGGSKVEINEDKDFSNKSELAGAGLTGAVLPDPADTESRDPADHTSDPDFQRSFVG